MMYTSNYQFENVKEKKKIITKLKFNLDKSKLTRTI